MENISNDRPGKTEQNISEGQFTTQLVVLGLLHTDEKNLQVNSIGCYA